MPRTAKPRTHPRAQLHRHPTIHNAFIAPDLDEPGVYWTWRDMPDGWGKRDRIEGAIESLPRLEAWRAFNSGWPGARPLPKPVKAPRPNKTAEERLTCVARTMVTIEELSTYQIEAHTMDMTLSAYLRRCIHAGRAALASSDPNWPVDRSLAASPTDHGE